MCAISAVLGNRFFLVLTGYPQLGNGTLHISHAIWGGLMMAIVIIFAISYLPPSIRAFVAFSAARASVGSSTSSASSSRATSTTSSSRPSRSIYITFVVMYLVFRTLQQRAFQPAEAVLNAIEALKSASLGRLDDVKRRQAIVLLDSTKAQGALADEVRSILVDVPHPPAALPGMVRAHERGDASTIHTVHREAVVRRHREHDLSGLRVRDRCPGREPALRDERVAGSRSGPRSSRRSCRCVHHHRRLPAARLADQRAPVVRAGLLVDILVTQVFVFVDEQLAGLSGLAFSIVVWLLVRSAINAESERENMAMLGLAPDSAAPAQQPVS